MMLPTSAVYIVHTIPVTKTVAQTGNLVTVNKCSNDKKNKNF